MLEKFDHLQQTIAVREVDPVIVLYGFFLKILRIDMKYLYYGISVIEVVIK